MLSKMEINQIAESCVKFFTAEDSIPEKLQKLILDLLEKINKQVGFIQELSQQNKTDAIASAVDTIRRTYDTMISKITDATIPSDVKTSFQHKFSLIKERIDAYKEESNKFSKKPFYKYSEKQRFFGLNISQLLLLEKQQVFLEMLEKLEAYCITQYGAVGKVFMCFAYPHEKYNEKESWVKDFLGHFHDHLKRAGIVEVLLSTRDAKHGENIYKFMDGAKDSDFVIVVGTESLREKHMQGTTALATELNNILEKRKLDKEKGLNRVLPITISGELETAFPISFPLYMNICEWVGESYLASLKNLIIRLYGVSESDQENGKFREIWQAFEKTYDEDGLLTKPLTDEIISNYQSQKPLNVKPSAKEEKYIQTHTSLFQPVVVQNNLDYESISKEGEIIFDILLKKKEQIHSCNDYAINKKFLVSENLDKINGLTTKIRDAENLVKQKNDLIKQLKLDIVNNQTKMKRTKEKKQELIGRLSNLNQTISFEDEIKLLKEVLSTISIKDNEIILIQNDNANQEKQIKLYMDNKAEHRVFLEVQKTLLAEYLRVWNSGGKHDKKNMVIKVYGDFSAAQNKEKQYQADISNYTNTTIPQDDSKIMTCNNTITENDKKIELLRKEFNNCKTVMREKLEGMVDQDKKYKQTQTDKDNVYTGIRVIDDLIHEIANDEAALIEKVHKLKIEIIQLENEMKENAEEQYRIALKVYKNRQVIYSMLTKVDAFNSEVSKLSQAFKSKYREIEKILNIDIPQQNLNQENLTLVNSKK